MQYMEPNDPTTMKLGRYPHIQKCANQCSKTSMLAPTEPTTSPRAARAPLLSTHLPPSRVVSGCGTGGCKFFSFIQPHGVEFDGDAMGDCFQEFADWGKTNWGLLSAGNIVLQNPCAIARHRAYGARLAACSTPPLPPAHASSLRAPRHRCHQPMPPRPPSDGASPLRSVMPQA